MFSLRTRIKQLCGWDIKNQTGRTYKRAGRRNPAAPQNQDTIQRRKTNKKIREEIDLQGLLEDKEEYKELLYQEFPHLDNPIYETQVNSLAEAIVKLDDISMQFLAAKDKDLESQLKIREGLKKDVDDFMKQLRIHPSQIKERTDSLDDGSMGTLIQKFEEFGEIATLYERVDAVQEAIQTVRQLEQLRVDGSPQLADWLLWSKTGMKPFHFCCPKCNEEYELYDGFTLEEMYQVCEQAFNTFGFGIEKVENDKPTTNSKIIEA